MAPSSKDDEAGRMTPMGTKGTTKGTTKGNTKGNTKGTTKGKPRQALCHDQLAMIG